MDKNDHFIPYAHMRGNNHPYAWRQVLKKKLLLIKEVGMKIRVVIWIEIYNAVSIKVIPTFFSFNPSHPFFPI